MNKTALFVSIALTTFVLMTIGGVAYLLRPAPVEAAPVEASAPATEALDEIAVETDPALVQAWLAREAEYQKLIEDANTRLTELQQLVAQTEAPGVDPTPAQITAEQAAQIAADYIGQTRVFWVQLVELQGASVYEVTFPAGDMVYVSLDGQVVASTPAPVFSSGGGGGGAGMSLGGNNGSGQDDSGEDHDDEHEDDDDDDHEDDDHD